MIIKAYTFKWALSLGVSWNISDKQLAFHFLSWSVLIDYSGQR